MRRALAKAIAGLLGVACVAAGCGEEEAPPAANGPLRGELSVDIREVASVTLRDEGGAVQASIKLTKGYGVLPAGAELSGAGFVEAFPEAGVSLYTARFDAPADPSGPCGAEPVSLALSLHRRGDAPRTSGSLAAYCGKGVWHGTPARMLRLAGDMKR